jgi:hypothetical protein
VLKDITKEGKIVVFRRRPCPSILDNDRIVEIAELEFIRPLGPDLDSRPVGSWPGCTEQPCDDASRYGDGTLRLIEAYIAKRLEASLEDMKGKYAGDSDFHYEDGYSDACTEIRRYVAQIIKEKACSAGGTTPTSTPSP